MDDETETDMEVAESKRGGGYRGGYGGGHRGGRGGHGKSKRCFFFFSSFVTNALSVLYQAWNDC